MKFHELFPLTFAQILNKQENVWRLEFEISNVQNLIQFYEAYEQDVARDSDHERIISTSNSFCADLVDIAGKYPEFSSICQFLKFSVCASLSNYFIGRKVSEYAKYWIYKSLDDAIDFPSGANKPMDRFIALLQDPSSFIQLRALPVTCIWVSSLFYYAWWKEPKMDLSREFMETFGNPFIGSLRHLANSEEKRCGHSFDIHSLNALGNMFFWLKNTKYDQWFFDYVSEVMLEIYNNQKISREWRKDIALKFSNPDTLVGGKTSKEWCAIIFNEFDDLLKAQQRLTVWLNYVKFDNELAVDNLNFITASIDEYRAYFSKDHERDRLINYELSTIYEATYEFMINLMLGGYVEAAETVFLRFFKLKDYSLIGHNILHVVPDGPNGVIYLCNELGYVNPYSSKRNIREFILAQEEFYNLRSDDPSRRYVPISDKAPAYEKFIFEYFEIAAHKDLFECCPGYFLHFEGNLPLQAVVAKTYAKCLPLVTSFTVPEEARPMNNMMIWQDDTHIAAEEAKGIIFMLKERKVSFTLLKSTENDVEDFKRHYESDEYDHIHVCSHGNYDHTEPHVSFIQLARELKIPIQILQEFNPSWSKRRLLFLNICDGATTSLLNSPASIGFVPALTSRNQSLISHLWPVNQRAALVWGWLITACRLSNMSYEESYITSIATFAKGKEQILIFLRDFVSDPELLSRIENLDIDYFNFYYWGSAIYLT